MAARRCPAHGHSFSLSLFFFFFFFFLFFFFLVLSSLLLLMERLKSKAIPGAHGNIRESRSEKSLLLLSRPPKLYSPLRPFSLSRFAFGICLDADSDSGAGKA